MPWNPSFQTDHSYPPHLAVYDNTVARLWHDNAPVGYVSFKLDQMATQTGGTLWWRRYSDPYDIVWYLEVLYPDTPHERVDDGLIIATDPQDIDPDNWKVSPWQLKTDDPDPSVESSDQGPIVLRVEFLTGDERDMAWERYGWGEE